MVAKPLWGGVVSTALGATSLLVAGAAFPATHDDIVAACKEQARPAVVECVRSRSGTADKETLIAQCRESAGHPFVIACVRREEEKEAAGKAAPAAPKADAPNPADAALVDPAGLRRAAPHHRRRHRDPRQGEA